MTIFSGRLLALMLAAGLLAARVEAVGCGDGLVDTDLGEACDQGIANGTPESCCTATTLRMPGEVCRPAAGPCDAAESCDGASAVCPADVGLPDGDGDGVLLLTRPSLRVVPARPYQTPGDHTG
jgi:hypothetical protein